MPCNTFAVFPITERRAVCVKFLLLFSLILLRFIKLFKGLKPLSTGREHSVKKIDPFFNRV